MTALNVKTQETLVSESTAAIQGSSATLLDFSVGSILLSIVEAYSAVVLWLQGLILGAILYSRASTSNDADLDSWMAQFDFIRIAAIQASGNATFSRFTATAAATLAVGTLCQTSDGTQKFAVLADTTNPAFNATTQLYTLAIGVSSMTVPVLAVTAGAAGNVGIGAIKVLSQAVSGIDTVTNSAAFTNGSDKETDSAFRIRFIVFINSLTKGTKISVIAAILSIAKAITPSIVENKQYVNGLDQFGYFYAIVDDGTGIPNSTFLNDEYNAIDAVRPLSVGFSVFAPQIVTANTTIVLQITAGQDNAAVIALVTTAVTNYINSLTSGQTCSLTQIAKFAYQASPYVENVTGLMINGVAQDLTSTVQQVIKSGTIGVTA